MKKFLAEFKEFAMRGNVMDLAVGVIIGGAFKGIVDSLVNDIISPVIGILAGQNFSDKALNIGGASMNKLHDMVKKPEEKKEPRKCPYCLSVIPDGATRCPHCTSELPGAEK